MSMIYSALREIDKPAGKVDAAAVATPPRLRFAAPALFGVALAGAAGAAAWALLDNGDAAVTAAVTPPPAVAAGAFPASVAVPAPLDIAEAPATMAMAPADQPAVLAPPAAALPIPAISPLVTPDAAPPAAEPAAPEAPPQPAEASPRASIPAVFVRPTAAAPTPAARTAVVDNSAQEARIAAGVAEFNAAMGREELGAAAEALARLGRELRPESITLLRLRAWHAMAAGDAGQARLLYGEILHRLPGDENAGVNAAILAWDAGRHDDARAIIEGLRVRNPDSELLRHYRQAMQRQ